MKKLLRNKLRMIWISYLAEEIGLKEKEEGSSWARRAIADPLLALGKGVTQLPDVVSGLADTVS
jgi:hypothetical protein